MAPLHLFCVEGSGDWLKIWHKHFLPTRALPSWPAAVQASANCMDLMWNDGTEMTHSAK